MYLYELFEKIRDTPDDKWNTSEKKCEWLIDVDHNNKKIILTFEESRQKLDWVFNFIFWPTMYRATNVYKNQVSPIKAHTGFVREFKSVNDEIATEILNILNEHPDYEIIIAGWSLGGAVAQLAAEDINFRTRKDVSDPNTGIKPKVVTFGSPKVFVGEDSVRYVRDCCSSIYQCAQINDIVTYCVPLPDYYHLSILIHGEKGRIGEKFKIKKLFDPYTYHCAYGKPADDAENIDFLKTAI